MYISRYIMLYIMIKRCKEQHQQMKPRMIRFSSDTWEAARKKAGITPLSAIVRQLVTMWLAGEIEVNNENQKNGRKKNDRY